MTFLFWYLAIGLIAIALAVAVEPEMRIGANAQGVVFVSFVLLLFWPIFAAWVIGRICGDWLEGK